jgi:hypothetical protein
MKSPLDRIPPHSVEAEQGALGCILLTPERAPEMLAKLDASDFYDNRMRVVFHGMWRLVNAGRAPEAMALSQHFRDRDELDELGGIPFVSSLADSTPSAASFPSFVATLKDKAWRRRLLDLAGHAAEVAHDEKMEAAAASREFCDFSERIFATGGTCREWFKFYTPGECRDYTPPPGHLLVGDSHLVRGSVTVIAGAPGVGKSRAATALSIAGATGVDWFGLPVHSRFKTAILQNENGRYRLAKEFAELDTAALNEFVRVSDRPPFGLAFDSHEFRRALSQWLGEFKPGVVVFDPWNGITRDDKQRDYREAFDALLGVLPKGDEAPAIVIVAHTRKPKSDERRTGRGLLHELAGAHLIGSVPRCAFVMQAASEDETDDRIVWTCCKNNDGELGPRTAWHRRNGLFAPCENFEWTEFDTPAEPPRTITIETLDSLFEGGRRRIAKATAVKELEAKGWGRTAAYTSLAVTGRFKANLKEGADGLLEWNP